MVTINLISAQPAETYFAWQLAVQLENFRQVGIDLTKCHVLLAKQGDLPDSILSLIGQYQPMGVNFFIANDTNVRRYSPSVRFWLLDQYQHQKPEVFQDRFFYHDSDIIFSKLPEFSIDQDNETWYGADAQSYLNVEYITGKGAGLLENMCSIIGISPMKVKCNNKQAGGVQYLLKGVPEYFFRKCEIDSERMYRFLAKSIDTYRFLHAVNTGKKDYHPIQHWCTDMWVLWWNALISNKTFEISDELSFTWATDPIEKWGSRSIFHNAGVSVATPELFNKTDFKTDIPIGREITTSEKFCSWHYVEAIKRTPCL